MMKMKMNIVENDEPSMYVGISIFIVVSVLLIILNIIYKITTKTTSIVIEYMNIVMMLGWIVLVIYVVTNYINYKIRMEDKKE